MIQSMAEADMAKGVAAACPTSPDGSEGGDGCASLTDSGACGVAAAVFEVAGFSAADMGASEEKRVEPRWL
jgi:hypothetical protein